MTKRKLLVVEDEVMIAEILADALREAGFKVDCAYNGCEALAHVKQTDFAYDALITDVRIGGLADGWQVARHARERAPALPVVYISGDSAHEWSSKGVENSLMLAKPFLPENVLWALSEAEDRAAGRTNAPTG